MGASRKYNAVSASMKKVIFQNKCSLKSHMDSVRGLHFLPSMNALVSASEDCTLKVWDINKFMHFKELENIGNAQGTISSLNFEPYITLRGHLDAVLCLTGTISQTND